MSEERPKIFPEVGDCVKLIDFPTEGEWEEKIVVARGREFLSKNARDEAGWVPDIDQYFLRFSDGTKLVTYWQYHSHWGYWQKDGQRQEVKIEIVNKNGGE